jgi:hypothetical protein
VASEDGLPLESIVIENTVLQPGSKVGEGFACDIFVVQVTTQFVECSSTCKLQVGVDSNGFAPPSPP